MQRVGGRSQSAQERVVDNLVVGNKAVALVAGNVKTLRVFDNIIRDGAFAHSPGSPESGFCGAVENVAVENEGALVRAAELHARGRVGGSREDVVLQSCGGVVQNRGGAVSHGAGGVVTEGDTGDGNVTRIFQTQRALITCTPAFIMNVIGSGDGNLTFAADGDRQLIVAAFVGNAHRFGVSAGLDDQQITGIYRGNAFGNRLERSCLGAVSGCGSGSVNIIDSVISIRTHIRRSAAEFAGEIAFWHILAAAGADQEAAGLQRIIAVARVGEFGIAHGKIRGGNLCAAHISVVDNRVCRGVHFCAAVKHVVCQNALSERIVSETAFLIVENVVIKLAAFQLCAVIHIEAVIGRKDVVCEGAIAQRAAPLIGDAVRAGGIGAVQRTVRAAQKTECTFSAGFGIQRAV